MLDPFSCLNFYRIIIPKMAFFRMRFYISPLNLFHPLRVIFLPCPIQCQNFIFMGKVISPIEFTYDFRMSFSPCAVPDSTISSLLLWVRIGHYYFSKRKTGRNDKEERPGPISQALMMITSRLLSSICLRYRSPLPPQGYG